MPGSLISSFYIQNFARDISSPITDLQAYKSGLVDENGNIIGQESSIDAYEYLIIKLKKIFSQLPGGMTKSSLASFLPALKMFTEEASWYGVDENQLSMFIEGYISSNTEGDLSYISLLEDMGTGGGAGSIGTPASAPGANTGGVSGFDPVMGKMQRRNQNVPSFIDTCQMFDVCPEEFDGFTNAQEWRQVPDGPTRNYLQRYQRRNPQGKMAVRNSETGKIHWLQIKPKIIAEDFDVSSQLVDRDQIKQYAKDNKIKPVEPSPKELRDVVKTGISKAKKAEKQSDVFEKEGQVDVIVSDGNEFEELRKTDPDFAATVLGVQKHFVDRSPSSNSNRDMLKLARDPNSGRIGGMFLDFKNQEWAPTERIPSKEEGYGDFGGIITDMGLEDPFEMFASATQHGGNVDFEENRAAMDRARKIAREMMGGKQGQEAGMELLRKKMEKGVTLVGGMPGQRIMVPGTEIVPHIQYRQQNVGKRGGQRLGIALGQGTGQRIEDYIETVKANEEKQRKAEEAGKKAKIVAPKAFISEPKTRFSPKLFKGKNLGIFTQWARDRGVLGEIPTPSADDIDSFSRSLEIGQDDPIYQAIMRMYGR